MRYPSVVSSVGFLPNRFDKSVLFSKNEVHESGAAFNVYNGWVTP